MRISRLLAADVVARTLRATLAPRSCGAPRCDKGRSWACLFDHPSPVTHYAFLPTIVRFITFSPLPEPPAIRWSARSRADPAESGVRPHSPLPWPWLSVRHPGFGNPTSPSRRAKVWCETSSAWEGMCRSVPIGGHVARHPEIIPNASAAEGGHSWWWTVQALSGEGPVQYP